MEHRLVGPSNRRAGRLGLLVVVIGNGRPRARDGAGGTGWHCRLLDRARRAGEISPGSGLRRRCGGGAPSAGGGDQHPALLQHRFGRLRSRRRQLRAPRQGPLRGVDVPGGEQAVERSRALLDRHGVRRARLALLVPCRLLPSPTAGARTRLPSHDRRLDGHVLLVGHRGSALCPPARRLAMAGGVHRAGPHVRRRIHVRRNRCHVPALPRSGAVALGPLRKRTPSRRGPVDRASGHGCGLCGEADPVVPRPLSGGWHLRRGQGGTAVLRHGRLCATWAWWWPVSQR